MLNVDSKPFDKPKLTHIPNATTYAKNHRPLMMAAMNEIIGENWNVNEPHWSIKNSPFTAGHGLVFVEFKGQLVGFSVYRTFPLDDAICLYRSGTELRGVMQNRGIYGQINDLILRSILDANTRLDKVYYCWRTRNAIVTHTHAKLCHELVPLDCVQTSKRDLTHLHAIAKQAANFLYPTVDLEIPNCIMRGVYGHIDHHRPIYRGTVESLAQQIEYLVPDTQDAIFFMGSVLREVTK